MKMLPEMADGSECKTPLVKVGENMRKMLENVLKNVRNIGRELAMVDVLNCRNLAEKYGKNTKNAEDPVENPPLIREAVYVVPI